MGLSKTPYPPLMNLLLQIEIKEYGSLVKGHPTDKYIQYVCFERIVHFFFFFVIYFFGGQDETE